MKNNLFYLDILTPERLFFEGEVEALTFSAEDGEWTVLANHAPMIAVLHADVVRWKQDGIWKEAVNSEGYMEVTAHRVVLFCQTCEWHEDVDLNRAMETKVYAQEGLRQARSQAEFKNSQIMLARAMARLRNGHQRTNLG